MSQFEDWLNKQYFSEEESEYHWMTWMFCDDFENTYIYKSFKNEKIRRRLKVFYNGEFNR